MRKNTIIAALALTIALQADAQTQGSITPEMLAKIQKEQKLTAADNALANAIAANAIDDLAKNRKAARQLDTHFSIETPEQSITNQKSSGRCWMFSGMNVLRADFARRTDSLRVDFSQAYLFFYDQLEKANLFLQGVVNTAKKPIDDPQVQFFFKSPINDGGTFCGVADLTEKYGLVPKQVMPESFSSDNTSKMASLLKSRLREDGLTLRKMVAEGKKNADIEKAKTGMLATIYRMLALTIGEPPTEFTYAHVDKKGNSVGETKTYTPQEFYKEVVGEKLNGTFIMAMNVSFGTFIMAMNDPRRPYYKTYEVELDRHTYDGHNWKYINLPMDDIEQMAIASLKDGKKMYSSYDVAKMLDRKRGYGDTENFDYGSLLGTSFNMTKAERISTFDSGSTHAMTLTAVDLDKDGKATKWKVENSWGADWGQKGCMIMSDRWVREYMFRLVIDKKYVPETILKQYEQKPTMVTYDDPLFGEDQ